MQCSISKLLALIAAAIAILAGATAAANFGGPPGWLVAAGLATGAIAVVYAIEIALREYRACRDAAASTSACSTASMNNLIAAVRVVIGIAVTSFLTAAVIFWNIFAGGPVAALISMTAGLVACGIAVALLIALLATAVSYKSCRDTASTQPPLGSGSSGLTTADTRPVTVTIVGGAIESPITVTISAGPGTTFTTKRA